MPIISVEDVTCPVCGEVFDLDDVNTEEPDAIEPTCPECGSELVGTYDPATGKVTLEEVEDDDLTLLVDSDLEEDDEDDPDETE